MIWALVGFTVGLGLGSLLQGYAWASNAKNIQHKEWMGKLFKVVPAKTWDEVESREAAYEQQRRAASQRPQVQR